MLNLTLGLPDFDRNATCPGYGHLIASISDIKLDEDQCPSVTRRLAVQVEPIDLRTIPLGQAANLMGCLATVQLRNSHTGHTMVSGITVKGAWTTLKDGTVKTTAQPVDAVTSIDGQATFFSPPISSESGYGCLLSVVGIPGYEVDPASNLAATTSWP